MWNKLDLFLFTSSLYISLRWVSGGLHCKTFWGCFLCSFLTINGLVFLPPLLPPGIYLSVLLVLSWIGGLLAWNRIPYTAPVRPIRSQRLKQRLRIAFIILLTGWSLVICLFSPGSPLYACGVITLIAHTVELYLTKKGTTQS